MTTEFPEIVSTTEQSSPGSGPDSTYVFYVCAEVLIGFLATLGNAMVIAAIATEERLQNITNYLLASLAGADLLVGVLGIPCALLAFNGLPRLYIGCLVMNSMIIILTQISIFGLLAIALERFYAIAYPLHYNDKCTMRTATTVITATYLGGICVGILPGLAWNMTATYNNVCAFTAVISMEYMVYFNFFGCVLLPLTIIFIVYIYIYHVVRKQIKQIHAIQNIAVVTIMTSQDNSSQTSAAQKKHNFKQQIKAAKWFAVVIGLFTLCWLPIHIMNCVTLLVGKTCFPCLLAAILLSHTNSAINPILYAFSNSKFKMAFRKMLHLPVVQVHDGASFSDNTNTAALSHM